MNRSEGERIHDLPAPRPFLETEIIDLRFPDRDFWMWQIRARALGTRGRLARAARDQQEKIELHLWRSRLPERTTTRNRISDGLWLQALVKGANLITSNEVLWTDGSNSETASKRTLRLIPTLHEGQPSISRLRLRAQQVLLLL